MSDFRSGTRESLTADEGLWESFSNVDIVCQCSGTPRTCNDQDRWKMSRQGCGLGDTAVMKHTHLPRNLRCDFQAVRQSSEKFYSRHLLRVCRGSWLDAAGCSPSQDERGERGMNPQVESRYDDRKHRIDKECKQKTPSRVQDSGSDGESQTTEEPSPCAFNRWWMVLNPFDWGRGLSACTASLSRPQPRAYVWNRIDRLRHLQVG